MSASVPPPPDVTSAAGAHFAPSHFKTCPVLGADVVVSTSLNASIDIFATSEAVIAVANSTAVAPEFTLKSLPPCVEKLAGVSDKPAKEDDPPPPPDTASGFHDPKL